MRVSRGKVKRVVNPLAAAKREARRQRDGAFVALLKRHGILEPEQEFQFALGESPPREWRFDFAWPGWTVAVEVEGGAWSKGRHTRGAGFIADMQKYNTAALLGWKVLRITPQQMDDLNTVALIKRALSQT